MRLPLRGALIASLAVSACAHRYTPPEISYDDTPKPAVLAPDPPKPVRIVELPKPLPLPGQLKPTPGVVARGAPEAADPRARIEAANNAARVQPTRADYVNAVQVYPFSDGATGPLAALALLRKHIIVTQSLIDD